MSPEQVRTAAERRIAAAKSGVKIPAPGPAPEKDGKQKYYTGIFADGTFHEYVNARGNQTWAETHVHVTHDERNDEVRLHIAIGSGPGRHSERIALVGASGQDVNAAVDLLTEALRARGH